MSSTVKISEINDDLTAGIVQDDTGKRDNTSAIPATPATPSGPAEICVEIDYDSIVIDNTSIAGTTKYFVPLTESLANTVKEYLEINTERKDKLQQLEDQIFGKDDEEKLKILQENTTPLVSDLLKKLVFKEKRPNVPHTSFKVIKNRINDLLNNIEDEFRRNAKNPVNPTENKKTGTDPTKKISKKRKAPTSEEEEEEEEEEEDTPDRKTDEEDEPAEDSQDEDEEAEDEEDEEGKEVEKKKEKKRGKSKGKEKKKSKSKEKMRIKSKSKKKAKREYIEVNECGIKNCKFIETKSSGNIKRHQTNQHPNQPKSIISKQMEFSEYEKLKGAWLQQLAKLRCKKVEDLSSDEEEEDSEESDED